jgi:hypothetical protein
MGDKTGRRGKSGRGGRTEAPGARGADERVERPSRISAHELGADAVPAPDASTMLPGDSGRAMPRSRRRAEGRNRGSSR